jgi:hypothetical protein
MRGVLKQGRKHKHRVVDSRIGKALNIIYTLSIRNRHLSQ